MLQLVGLQLRISRASATPLPDGRLRLDVGIEASRSEHQGRREVGLPMDEELDLAVYADDPGTDGRRAVPLHSGRYRVRGNERIALEVDGAARFVLLDPGLLRIDRNRADNLREVELGPRP